MDGWTYIVYLNAHVHRYAFTLEHHIVQSHIILCQNRFVSLLDILCAFGCLCLVCSIFLDLSIFLSSQLSLYLHNLCTVYGHFLALVSLSIQSLQMLSHPFSWIIHHLHALPGIYSYIFVLPTSLPFASFRLPLISNPSILLLMEEILHQLIDVLSMLVPLFI